MYDVDPRQGSLDEVDAGWFGTDEGTLPIGAPFRPGLDPLPPRQHVWAVVKDRWGRPAHGEPRSALRRVTMPVRLPGPDEALGYVLYAGLTYNTIFAARGVPISVFDLHDRDLHVPGSGAVVLVAALGRETARQGRLKVGELRVLYPGSSDLLSPRAGADPMHADFRIQGYETPDGSFTQFVRCQAPQLLAHSERLTLPEASSYMLDLETVYKALYDVARVDYDERVFIEGAAGGTGLYAVACSALRGARVTGLVSTEEKGRLVLARGGLAYVNRKDPALAGAFVPVPRERSGRASWLSAGRKLVEVVRDRNGGALIDVVVSSVGRDLFPRMIDLLAPSGRLVFYGATSGYTLTFLGKPGNARAGEMMRRGGLRPHHGVLVYYGGRGAADPVGDDAISTAVHAGARVAVATRTDAEAVTVKAAHRVAGVVSLQTLARDAGFRWPDAMPDYDVDPDGFREYQDRTLKPFGQAVGRVLATPDNPRGNPDMIVERAGQDTLGVSTFLARPFTGVVVYLEATSDDRLSFYAPNVWMHQKRVLFPTFAILGSHLSNAQQAEEVVRLLDAGALTTQPPAVEPWEALAEANQAIHENRHAGTITTRVGATAALDEARTARQVYEAWGSRFVDGKAVRVRIDPVRPGAPARVALVTIDVPPANALSAATLDDLERALDVLETEPDLGAAVLTGARLAVRGRGRHPPAARLHTGGGGRGPGRARAGPVLPDRPAAGADDRRRRRLRAGRRQRAADGLRLAGRRAAGRARPAGDQPARDSRLRRHADAAAPGRAPSARRRRPALPDAGRGPRRPARRPPPSRRARAGPGPDRRDRARRRARPRARRGPPRRPRHVRRCAVVAAHRCGDHGLPQHRA